ncbi:hypothetical protein N7509_004718 [Penicillium cosmopolitanum]|uniref:Uncharacterized protein n=1 Tax=Penicillium cosmopolitanum TaxID=1131564 RepID=A0A9W9W0V1_9EURO|nr:uncharacterized protein N7509_004718 [Penicillium cosmopolitanum]KAJ5396605.1 hypothetical protein N7509_004718 [Penicillium cosmopolitanum]
MKQMQWKFGGSEMVLRKIFKLQRQVDAFIEERPLAGGIETPGRITNDPCDYLEELFPFPPYGADTAYWGFGGVFSSKFSFNGKPMDALAPH